MDLKTYRKNEDRILAKLDEIDPADDAYGKVLYNLLMLGDTAVRCLDAKERVRFEDENRMEGAEPEPIKITPIPVAEVKAPEPDSPEITFEEVKARFVAAARSGIKVADILAAAGYEKLSDVPSSDYDELLDALPGVN